MQSVPSAHKSSLDEAIRNIKEGNLIMPYFLGGWKKVNPSLIEAILNSKFRPRITLSIFNPNLKIISL
jgi:hypothetical protein